MSKIAKDQMVVICEDVRDEQGSKISLMGVHGGTIYISETPMILPKFCAVLFYSSLLKKIEAVGFSVKGPELSIDAKRKKAAPEISKGDSGHLVLVLSPFRINQIGDYQINFFFTNDEKPDFSHKFKIALKGDEKHPANA